MKILLVVIFKGHTTVEVTSRLVKLSYDDLAGSNFKTIQIVISRSYRYSYYENLAGCHFKAILVVL